MKSTYLRWAAFFFALFHIYCNVFASISELWLSAIHFGGFCAICALMSNEDEEIDRDSIRYWVNIGIALIAVATSAYLILFENALYARETEYILSDDNDDPDKFQKYLNIVIPKTKDLFNMIKKYIVGKLTFIAVLDYLQPFLIYLDDITFKQYEDITKFIEQKIRNGSFVCCTNCVY